MTTQHEQSRRQRAGLLQAIGDTAKNTRDLADAIRVSVRTAHYHLGALEASGLVVRYGSCGFGVIWVRAGSDLGELTRYLAGESIEALATSRLKRQRQGPVGWAAALLEARNDVEAMLRARLEQPGPAPLRRVQR